MLKILTDDEVITAFGDPFPYIRADGTAAAGWQNEILAEGKLPAPLPLSFNRTILVTRFRAHFKVVHHLERALNEIHETRQLWDTINDWGGCYSFRANRRNPKKLSRHSWGLGPDMDVSDNAQGSAPSVPEGIIEIMEHHGFAWGGYFKGKAIDGMHWEFARLDLLRAEMDGPVGNEAA